MTKVLFLICMLFAELAMAKPVWVWGRYGVNTGDVVASHVATDDAGNLYDAGAFDGSLDFSGLTIYAAGAKDVFWTKYDRSGVLRQVVRIGDAGTTTVYGLVVDPVTQDVYITGTFEQQITLGGVTYQSGGLDDMYLVKYNASGMLVWARTYGSGGRDLALAMALSANRLLVIGGYYSGGSIQFGSLSVSRSGSSSSSGFILGIDSSGVPSWAEGLGGGALPVDIKADKLGNVFIAGSFASSMQLPGGAVLESISSGNFLDDVFVTKFRSSGQLEWAQVIGGIGPPGTSFGALRGLSGAVDASGRYIVGGNIGASTLVVGGLNLGGRIANSGFMVRYDTDGAVQWAKALNGTVNGFATDQQCSIYAYGVAFVGTPFGSDTVRHPSQQDPFALFVVKFDSAQNQQWLQTAGDSSGASCTSVAVLSPDNLVVSGVMFSGSSINFGNTTCYNTGNYGNGFVARMSSTPTDISPVPPPSVAIFPNPASSVLHLVHKGSERYSGYKLLNALGQCVGTGTLTKDQQQELRLPSLASGLYYVELSGNGYVVRKQVSIQQ